MARFARSLGVVVLLTSFSLTTEAVARAAAVVPRGFFGVVPQGQLALRDFDRMRGVVGTLRVPVFWPQLEPQPGEYDFAALDEVAALGADAGVRVLPFVYGSPRWVAGDVARPPLDSAADRRAWAGFLRRLVDRYGPAGDLWQGRARRMPIRRWQVWNEPNFSLFWRPRPSPVGYARLLRVSAGAIRSVDRDAAIVAAGVAPVESGMPPWTFLRKLYAVPGAAADFDLVAVHPYASTVAGVVLQIRRARRAMAWASDGRKPLLVSEVGVASGGSIPTTFDRGRRGQALFLRRAFVRLVQMRARWRIAGVAWFSWQDAPAADPHCAFCHYAGLFDSHGLAKPAWWAFRNVVEAVGRGSVR